MNARSFPSVMLAGVVLMSLLAGCASVSVDDQRIAHARKKAKPTKIYVRDFDITHADLNVDRSGAELERFKKKEVELMSSKVVHYLSKFYRVQRLSATAPTPRGNVLLLEGKFLRVNQGSRALRIVVGFGAGGTKMETGVRLYDASARPPKKLLSFATSGGSNAEPGIVSDPDPLNVAVSAATSVASSGGHGITDDTSRTARMIAYRISEYLAQQGWIPAEKAKTAKRLK